MKNSCPINKFMNENTKVEQNSIIYLLNEEERTASITEPYYGNGIINIPCSINHKNQEYTVTNILSKGFNYTRGRIWIQFAANSKIRKIEKNAFSPCVTNNRKFISSVESINIPSSLIELQKGWCKSAVNLKEIKISPTNPKYSIHDDNFIIGKSTPDKENYDILVFCVRNIETVIIPNFIETIEPYSFQGCDRIHQFEIQSDSKLRTIEKKAFSGSNISSFTIPSNLIELKDGWCKNTFNLTKINVDPKNQRYKLYENKFIIGKSSLDKEYYDVLVFCPRNAKIVSIPSFIEIIGSYSFQSCFQLKQVLIPIDSKLRIIQKNAFSDSPIEKFTLSPYITHIEKKAFYFCKKLTSVEIPNNSKLQIIGKSAFYYSSIQKISIPPHVKQICAKAFQYCENLREVEILPNSDLKIIGKCAFFNTSIKAISIPPHVTKICDMAFLHSQLKKIEIPENSELQEIEGCQFWYSPIEEIYIPENLLDINNELLNSNIKIIEINPKNPRYSNYQNKFIIGKSKLEKKNYDILVFCDKNAENVAVPSFIEIIGPYSFHNCKKLREVSFKVDSKLSIIDECAFKDSSIEIINIPTNLIKIGKSAFEKCKNLKRIEIHKDSKLLTIEENAFAESAIEVFHVPPHLKKIGINSFNFCKMLSQIEIPKNSELETIDDAALCSTLVNQLHIPSNLIDIKDEWCKNTPYLERIEISPDNPKYKLYDNKMIIGKSTPDKENYDVLVFCCRNRRNPENEYFEEEEEYYYNTLTIPSFIEIIGPYSFEKCNYQLIKIPTDSKLRIIGKGSFANSLIESISIPPHVTHICEDAFLYCKKLHRVEIPMNSDLQIIKEGAFCRSAIKSIVIPPHVTQICQNAFSSCHNLQHVVIPMNSNLQAIKLNAFAFTKIDKIIIPPHLSIIKDLTFSECINLKQIEIPVNSELQNIENNALSGCSNLEEINIPSCFTNFDSNSFCNRRSLTRIKVSPDNPKYSMYEDKFIIGKSTSEKENYDVLVFCVCNIETVIIPSFIEIIGPYSFKHLGNLKRVIIPIDSKLSIIDNEAFKGSSIEYISIPPSLNRICRFAFAECFNLTQIDLPTNPSFQTIEDESFEKSFLEKVLIPSNVKIIDSSAFLECNCLQKVGFQENSQLRIIKSDAFAHTNIESFLIPPNVEQISIFTFDNCENLQIIEFNEKIKIEDVDLEYWQCSKHLIIMFPYVHNILFID